MTIQSVDAYIAHSMNPDASPISVMGIFGAMLNGEFDELSVNDRDYLRLRLGYNGWITEIDGISIILDHGPDGIRFFVEDQGQRWEGDLTGAVTS